MKSTLLNGAPNPVFWEKAARIYLSRAGISPDVQVEGGPNGENVPAWQKKAAELFEFSEMANAIETASRLKDKATIFVPGQQT